MTKEQLEFIVEKLIEWSWSDEIESDIELIKELDDYPKP